MKNIKPYSGGCFSFHKNMIEAKNKTKKDSDYKERVSALNSDIEEKFKDYKKKFTSDSLEEIYAIEVV